MKIRVVDLVSDGRARLMGFDNVDDMAGAICPSHVELPNWEGCHEDAQCYEQCWCREIDAEISNGGIVEK